MEEGTPGTSLRVGIVGGSISGCAAAIELSRAGHEVSLYEKSSRELKGRGVGIATPIATLQALVARDLIAVDMPHFQVYRQPFIGRNEAEGRLGHTAWSAPVTLALVNWSDLYHQLRARVPDGVYHAGQRVNGAKMVDEQTAALTFPDGRQDIFDLVLFADGYRSLGRLLLFPDVALEYGGYILWLGSLEEAVLADSEPLEGQLPRVGFGGISGHGVFYLAPGHDGSVVAGQRRVNWTCALPVPIEALSSFLTDQYGRQRTGSIPPGAIRPALEAKLKSLMRSQLPAYYAELIDNTQDSSIQPVYRVDMPAYHRQRFCLIGDAGALTQPFTGSGVFKGTGNALELLAALREHADLDSALVEWSQSQTRIGQRLSAMGHQMEQAFVWAVPDFTKMDAGATAEWWHSAVSFPDGFSYNNRQES